MKYFKEYCMQQIKELVLYNPKHMWFDGDWKITQKAIREYIKNMALNMKKKGIIINDRLGIKDEDYSCCDYRVFSDRYIPKEKLDIKWQHVNTIGYSWGYNKEQTKKDYKSGQQIYQLYNTIVELGGELLINIGPDSDGNIIKDEVNAIEYLSSNIK
jgi:alpha-L-fucosidase